MKLHSENYLHNELALSSKLTDCEI